MAKREQPYRDLLRNTSSDKQATMPYEELCQMRRAASAEHVADMAVPASLTQWAALMQAEHGPTVKVWANTVGWLTALMIVRYGEAIEHWPAAFSAKDIKRAEDWLRGRIPAGVSQAPQAGGALMLTLPLALLALGGLLVALLGEGGWPWLLTLVPLMGSAMTDYLEGQVRAHIFRTASFTKPTVLAVALFTAAPGEAGGGTEVTGGAYARVQRDPLDANWTAVSATDGLTDNAADLTFPTPTANWGTITHFSINDATTAGNMLVYGALTTAKTVNNGDPAPKFLAGALDVTFA